MKRIILALALFSSSAFANNSLQCSGRVEDQVYQVNIVGGNSLTQSATVSSYDLLNRMSPAAVGQYSVVLYSLPSHSPSGPVNIYKDQGGSFSLLAAGKSSRLQAVLENGQVINLNLKCN